MTRLHGDRVWDFYWLRTRVLVVGNNLVDPAAELADTGVHGGSIHVAVTGTPGDNASEHPGTSSQADKRATRVTLEEIRDVSGGVGWGGQQVRAKSGAVAHLAGRGTSTTCTDHGIGDLGAPVLAALVHSDQGHSHLLQTCGGHIACGPEGVVK